MNTKSGKQGVKGWIQLGLVTLIAIAMVWICPQLAWAESVDLPSLTLEDLQQQLDAPVQRAGKPTIDLRGRRIELRSDKGDFRELLYRLLQTHLQSGSTAIGLDLSNAVIQGSFDLQRLSLREPLYGEALFPLLTEQEAVLLVEPRCDI